MDTALNEHVCSMREEVAQAYAVASDLLRVLNLLEGEAAKSGSLHYYALCAVLRDLNAILEQADESAEAVEAMLLRAGADSQLDLGSESQEHAETEDGAVPDSGSRE